jgi:hypothetical protein
VYLLTSSETVMAGRRGPTTHLVSDDHDAVLVCQLPQCFHEAWWGCQEAPLTQHWLQDYGSHI